jgi:hypothetical protein
MLTFLVGKESKLPEVWNGPDVLGSLLPISLSLSVSALLIDAAFVLSKLRVVAARNRLSEIAVNRAAAREDERIEHPELKGLFHLSGEELALPPFKLLVAGLWPLLALYLVTPLAIWLFVPAKFLNMLACG